MPMIWRQLFPEDAMAHPSYGLRGWLLALYVAVLATFLHGAYDVVAGVDEEILDQVVPTHTQIGLATALELVRTGLLLPFLILAPLAHRQMPAIAIACLWTSVTVSLLGLAVVPPPLVGAGPIAIAALAVVLTWYLISSERANVTYRRRTRDPGALAPSYVGEAPAMAKDSRVATRRAS
jgi:hypothetical protein